MFSMLLRAFHGSRAVEHEPLDDFNSAADTNPETGAFPPISRDNDPSPGPATHQPSYAYHRHATADFTEADDDDESNDGGLLDTGFLARDLHTHEDEDGDHRSSHMLPLFSASHLDSLPVYSIVHAIRIIVQTRTETTLSWEQLRSPQVSQFLVKPMQQQIATQHFTRATLYALMANCLQFAKEAQFNPGNAGTSNTRSKVCELLAIKLLKEYSTRGLIDALSYDFNPLQGLPVGPLSQQGSSAALSRDGRYGGLVPAARISTLEVAIRASAKHFLAHPLVVQQLEAIWNGAISFYSSADTLHRSNGKAPAVYASVWGRQPAAPRRMSDRRSSANDLRAPLLGHLHQQQHTQPGKEAHGRLHHPPPSTSSQPLYRRTVSLYDPRNASLFKLSRLRVPRYRQFLSTCSLAVLIGLFLAVLVQRSNRITTLELVFWFWSAGFMLDELVGFNEQGFSLYIMSFWNIFDLGILLLLIFYYSLRICGVFLADAQKWNSSAYDILAANAILLLPRIFSVLDHYQYFSQLLIAFRLMAVDLAAVFILVLVSCSGFFFFFTLSRADNDPSDVAYMIFQLLMGFTPAAWEVWASYNILGKTLLVLFLIISHFVVMTILITVLTNSFMAIASNADEEHQFLFAINTISMVKNDALFSYVAPTNIFAWMLMPLRYCMPLPQFVAINRLVIKVTHFPLLFGIFVYEKFFLAPFMYEPTDLVENHKHTRRRGISLVESATRPVLFSPSIRLREESVVGYQKDRALDEVFRRTPGTAEFRTQRRNERRKTQTVIRNINNWIDQNDGLVDPPHNFSTIDTRRASFNRERGGSHRFRHMSEVRSTASDPPDLLSLSGAQGLTRDPRAFGNVDLRQFETPYRDHTDAEGDDELVTNEDDEEDTNTVDQRLTPMHPRDEILRLGDATTDQDEEDDEDDEDGAYIATPVASRFLNIAARSPESSKDMDKDSDDNATGLAGRLDDHAPGATSPPKPTTSRRALHSRALSSNTILYNPPLADSSDGSLPIHPSPGTLFSPPSPKSGQPQPPPRARPHSSRRNTPVVPGTLTTSGHHSPRKSVHQGVTSSRPRPILPPREHTQTTTTSRTAAIFSNATLIDTPVRRAQRRMSSFDTGSDGPSELLTASAVGPPLDASDAAFGGNVALPGSFTSQLALATAMNNIRATDETDRDRDRMSRLVLARMKTLEESFTDVVRELRSLQKQQQQNHQEAMASAPVSAFVSSSEGETSDQDNPTPKPRPGPLRRAHSDQRRPLDMSVPRREISTVMLVPAPAPAAAVPTNPGPQTPSRLPGPSGPSGPPVSTEPPPSLQPGPQIAAAAPPVPLTPGGSNVIPKSPGSGSRIPVAAGGLPGLNISTPPGLSQLPRVGSAIMSGSSSQRQIPRRINSNGHGESEYFLLRKAKGKEVARDPSSTDD